jgi:hypothetical protein
MAPVFCRSLVDEVVVTLLEFEDRLFGMTLTGAPGQMTVCVGPRTKTFEMHVLKDLPV